MEGIEAVYIFRVFPANAEMAEVDEWLNEAALDEQWAVAKVDDSCPMYHLRSNEIDVGEIANLFMGEGDEMRAICPVFLNHESSRRFEDAAKFWLGRARRNPDWMVSLLEFIQPYGLKVRTALNLDGTVDLGKFLTKEEALVRSLDCVGNEVESSRFTIGNQGVLSAEGCDLLLPVLQEIIESEFLVLTDSDDLSEERIAEAIRSLGELPKEASQALEDLGVRFTAHFDAVEIERVKAAIDAAHGSGSSVVAATMGLSLGEVEEGSRAILNVYGRQNTPDGVEAMLKDAEASTSSLPKWRRWWNKLLRYFV